MKKKKLNFVSLKAVKRFFEKLYQRRNTTVSLPHSEKNLAPDGSSKGSLFSSDFPREDEVDFLYDNCGGLCGCGPNKCRYDDYFFGLHMALDIHVQNMKNAKKEKVIDYLTCNQIQLLYKNGEVNQFLIKTDLIENNYVSLNSTPCLDPLLLVVRHDKLQTHIDVSSLDRYLMIGFDEKRDIIGVTVLNSNANGSFFLLTLAKFILVISQRELTEWNGILSFNALTN